MECLPVTALPKGSTYVHEVKLDGWRLQAVKNSANTVLYSRRGNRLNTKFQFIADALREVPDSTILDGELVALDLDNKPNFSLLQNYRSAESRIHYYVFDILMLKGKLLTGAPLAERRAVLDKTLPINKHISLSAVVNDGNHLLDFVREHGLEGVVSKRADGIYEPGKRSGSWCKYRLELGQEFVIGGYTPGGNGFDALTIGFYKDKKLFFVARVRTGFIPATRREVFKRIAPLKVDKCPFVNLPEQSAGRWGDGLTREKMQKCVWVSPETVVRIDFVEWTGAEKLRHPKYKGLRDDKDPRKVLRET